MGISFAWATSLMFLRIRFLGWPLQPLGYVLSGRWSMNLIWFPLFLSWLVKWIVLKHGGLKAYREGIPFFLGLHLGWICRGERVDGYRCVRKLANVCFLDLTIQSVVKFHYVQWISCSQLAIYLEERIEDYNWQWKEFTLCFLTSLLNEIVCVITPLQTRGEC